MITGLDWINPVLLREYQQVVRSRAFLWIGSLWLIALLFISLMFVVTTAPRESAFTLSGPGQDYFGFIIAALAVVFFFVFPFNSFNRLVRERKEMTLELLSITRIRPGQIATGMLLATTMQILLFLFLCFPFVAFAYLCRGLELKTVLWSLYTLTICAIALNAASLTIASFCKTPRITMVVRALFVLGIVFALISGVNIFSEILHELRYLRSGTVSISAWVVMLLTTMTVAGIILTAQVFTRSNLTFESANRTTWPRLTVAGLFAAGHLILWICKWTGPYQLSVAIAFDLISFLALVAFTCWLMGESNQLSARQLESIPRNRPLRLLWFPFLPGRGSGFIYFLLIGGVTTLSLWFAINSTSTHDSIFYFVFKPPFVLFFGVASLIHHLFQTTRLRRWHFLVWFTLSTAIIIWLPVILGARPWDDTRGFIFLSKTDDLTPPYMLLAIYLRVIIAPLIGILCAVPSVIQNLKSIMSAKR